MSLGSGILGIFLMDLLVFSNAQTALGYRNVTLTTSSIYDYSMSLSRFRICLQDIKSIQFSVKTCHDARIILLTNASVDSIMHEIVIGSRNNLSYIQERTPDGSFNILNISEELVLSCTQFNEFLISWTNNRDLSIVETVFSNEKRLLRVSKQLETYTYATVSTGFGAIGVWSFKLEAQGGSEQVDSIIQGINLQLCPFVTECTTDAMITSCEKNRPGSSIYIKMEDSDIHCTVGTTEYIQLTVCTNTEQQNCGSCNIANYTLNANYLNEGKMHVHVMDVKKQCSSITNWNMYFKIVHYKSTDYGYRKIAVNTLPYYDYYMSLRWFQICLTSIETMNLTFHVQSCNGVQVVLLTSKGLDGPIYEVGFDKYHTYIQEKGQNGNSARNNKTDKISLPCNELNKFWISWGSDKIEISNTGEVLQLDKRMDILTHATVSSWSDGEWQFVFRDTGMLQPVDATFIRLCPLVADCSLNAHDSPFCNPITSDVDIVCSQSMVYLNFNCYKAGVQPDHQECSTEFIQITECVTSTPDDCKTCRIRNIRLNAKKICENRSIPYHLMNVTTCDFFDMHGWQTYLRYEYFKWRDHDDTTKDFVETTLTTTDAPSSPPITLPATTTTSTTTEDLTTVDKFDESQQKSNISLTLGIAIGASGLLLAVIFAIILLVFLKRSRTVTQKKSSLVIFSNGNDYTGNQSVALPSGGHNPISDEYTSIQLGIEEQNYQELTKTFKTENEVSYDYIDTTDVKRKSAPKMDNGGMKPEYVRHVKDLPDYPSQSDGSMYSVLDPDETGFDRPRNKPTIATDTEASSTYSMLDPTVTGFDRTTIPLAKPVETYAILDPSETGFNRMKEVEQSELGIENPLTDDKLGGISTQSPAKTVETYSILDPTETGFNRLENSNQSGYKTMEPLTSEPTVEFSKQPHCGEYNVVGDSVNTKTEENIYNHSVDNVYDCTSHNNRLTESDGTYDHFVGQ